MLALFQDALVLLGGTVHTMVPGEAPRVQDVAIEDGRIVALGELALERAGPDARRVDAAGLHVLPGLVDGMAHHDPDHDRLYLAAGVTLLRDAGNALSRSLAERVPAARARGPGPDLVIAGAVLDGVPPATTESIVLASAADVADKLPRLFDLGIDYVSLRAGLSRELWPEVVAAAHRRGLAVWGEKPRTLTFEALCAGDQDGLFHLDALLLPDETWDRLTFADLEPRLERLVASGMAVTPTLGVLARRLVPPPSEPPEFAYLSPSYRRDWLAEFEARRARAARDPEGYLRAGLAVVELQGRVVKTLFDKGVTLVPGSASPHAWLVPGEALVSELGLWVRAGIPAEDVLALATAGGATALGRGLQRGTLEPGRVADLVLVDGDPRQDLGVLARPTAVIVRGRLLERAELAELGADLARKTAALEQRARRPLEVQPPELPDGQLLVAGTVETRAGEERISAERFAVVREPGGALAYCGRLFAPGTVSTPDTELVLVQQVLDGRLQGFRLRIASGARALVLRGRRDGDQFVLERQADAGSPAAQEVRLDGVPAFVEAGSVTSQLALGQHGRPGALDVLYVDNGEPAAARFELRLDKDKSHLLRTAQGDVIVRFGPDGVPRQVLRRQGSALFETRPIAVEPAGAGLGLAADKLPPAEALVPPWPAAPTLPVEPVEAGARDGGR